MLRTVSVAMAVCNGEKYLVPQIDSILSQLQRGDELVISYDESSDGTFGIISSYAESDERVRVIKNDRKGIVSNFNNALRACCNDVIFISDQDDLWVEGKREKVVAALAESGAHLAIHNAVHVDSGERAVSRPLFEEYGIGRGLLKNFVRPRYSGCCMAFPIESRSLIMPMPEAVVNYDHWIGMVCEACGEVVFVDEVLLKHRLHGGNATVSRRPLGIVLRQRTNLLWELIRRRRELSV